MTTMQRLCALVGAMSICASGEASAQTCSGDESVCGQWGALTPLKLNSPSTPNKPMQAVHSFLLPNGKVLCIDGYNIAAPFDTDTHALLLNPADGSTQLLSTDHRFRDHLDVDHELFCSGHARLSDGRIVFRGGGMDTPGTPATTVYDPNGMHITYGAVGTFTAGPREVWNADGDPALEETQRWYPTCTTLGDGRILITDGWAPNGQSEGNGNVPVILQPNSGAPGTWTWDPLQLAGYGSPAWTFTLEYYSLMYQLKSGLLFMAGSHYNNMSDPNSLLTRTLSVSQELWADVGSTGTKAGSGCMFSSDIILKAGGGITGTQDNSCTVTAVTNRAFKIDFNAPTPQSTEVASMPHARLHFYLIPLPSGDVLAHGGTSGGATEHEMCNGPTAVLNPDVYNSSADTWTTLAPMATPRQYHSSAVLLPDGSIFVVGGQANGPNADPNWAIINQRTYQIFKPTYFFNGQRPTITTCPTSWIYNRGYNIDTPDAGSITKVRLIRLGSSTHSFDQHTRCLELEFTQIDSDTIRVSAPAHGLAAPPGHHMVFICRDLQTQPASPSNGRIPSVSKIIKRNGASGMGS